MDMEEKMRKTTVRKLKRVALERYAGYTWRSVKRLFNHVPRPEREKFLSTMK